MKAWSARNLNTKIRSDASLAEAMTAVQRDYTAVKVAEANTAFILRAGRHRIEALWRGSRRR